MKTCILMLLSLIKVSLSLLNKLNIDIPHLYPSNFMKHYLWLYFFIIGLLYLTNCKQEPKPIAESNKKEVVKSKFAQLYPDFNPKDFQDKLREYVEQDSISQALYAHIECNPVWVHDTLDTKSISELLQILEKVGEHGLRPDYFNPSEIKSMMDSIMDKSYGENLDTIYSKVSLLEKAATRIAVKYISGMKFGFTNPKELFDKKLYDINLASPDSLFLANLYSELVGNPIRTIVESVPSDSIYLKLQDEYNRLVNMEDTTFTKITIGSSNYKLGSSGKNILAIAKRLQLTEEYRIDSLKGDSLYKELDKELLDAVNLFRKRNSYLEENEVGLLTINALNRPINYYIENLAANMERYRWQRTKERNNKHIEVNVPAFMLIASDESNDSILISRVCVGTAWNKTPLMESNLSYMNLNPVWNIPKSIARGEVAVLQKKDPTYIKRKNMQLYKGGKEVDPESIDWEKVNPRSFSYTVRQQPGPENSLGLIKFMFNNSFSVYLHDTPSKAAFNRKNRAVSHGCIRVQKPFDLAVFCMSPVPEIYKDRLHYSVNKAVESKEGKELLKNEELKKLPDIINIPPDNKISLTIDYYTAFMYPNDRALYYADDIYEYDKIILTALKDIQ